MNTPRKKLYMITVIETTLLDFNNIEIIPVKGFDVQHAILDFLHENDIRIACKDENGSYFMRPTIKSLEFCIKNDTIKLLDRLFKLNDGHGNVIGYNIQGYIKPIKLE